MNCNCFCSQNYNSITEDGTSKIKYSYGNKRSQSVKKGKKKKINNHNSVNDTSKVCSSSEGYWERRYNKNQDKINEIKKQKEEKEIGELRGKPTISKNSKKIVKNLINQPYTQTMPVQRRQNTKENQKSQMKKKQNVKNSKGCIRGVDDLYLRARIQRSEEEIRNQQINNILYSTDTNQTQIEANNRSVVVHKSNMKQPSIKKNETLKAPLKNIRNRLNDFYTNKERINNYSSRVTFPDNYRSNTTYTNNSIPSHPINTKKLIQKKVPNKISTQQITTNNSIQMTKKDVKVKPPTTNNPINKSTNLSDIKKIEETYQKSLDLHSQIMNNLYPDSYSSQIIRNNPIASYREENNRRLQDLTYLSNYANNVNLTEKTSTVLSLTNKEQPIDNKMKLAYLRSETEAAERTLDYLNQKLRINQQKKEAILSQYNSSLMSNPAYLNSINNNTNQNKYIFYNYDEMKGNGISNSSLESKELLEEFRFKRRK